MNSKFISDKLLQECISWIYSKKPGYFTPLVITSHNNDDNPKLDIKQASAIFTILEERRLIIPIVIEHDNKLFQAYKINFDKEKEILDLINKRGLIKLYILPAIKWLWIKFWYLFAFIIALIFTSFFSAFFNKLGEKTFEYIFK